MELLILGSTLSFAVVGGLVGIRLLLLARRSGQLPELAIGLGLVLIAPLGYPLMMAATVPDLLPLPVARVLYALAMAVIAVGSASIFLFTWRVFRPDAPWAQALVAVAAVTLLIQAVASSVIAFLVPSLQIMNEASLWFAARQVVIMTSYGWTAVESLRYFGLLRRRMGLGLADPVVANRMLLWGLAGAISFCAAGFRTVMVMGGGDPLDSAAGRIAIGAGGALVATALYLAFLPPAPYLRWVGAARPPAHA